jgi:hypothetical protein
VGLTGINIVGDVINGIQAGGQVDRDVTMVNNLITVALNNHNAHFGSDPGDTYQRSGNTFSPLPTAIATGAKSGSGTGDIPDNGQASLTLDLSTLGTFTYLVAAYDGPNGGVEVWDIAGLTGTISIPRYAEPIGVDGSLQSSSRYLMTGWSLLNPGGGTSVPDGGATILLLGAGLSALTLGRRFIKL